MTLAIVKLLIIAALFGRYLTQETLDQIEMDEELDSGRIILNFTEAYLNRTNRSVELIKFESKKPGGQQFQLSEYFQIETKRTRNQQQQQNGSTTTNIMLRTSSRRLDREYLCRLSSLRSECSCEAKCLVWLDLLVDERPTRLPILVRDVNDAKPFFYTANLKIDLDLSGSTESAIRIPLKEAIDLDSMASNRVIEYRVIDEQVDENDECKISLERMNNSESGSADSDVITPSLSLLFEWTPKCRVDIASDGSSMFTRTIQLSALDPNHTATQTISLNLKLPLALTTTPSQVSSTRSTSQTNGGKLSWLNLVYFVSALNELDISYSNKSNFHEVSFRNRRVNSSSENESEQTLVYLIVEKSKFMSSRDSISIESEQFLDGLKPNSTVFRIHEMRNGLYSVSTRSDYYDLIRSLNPNTSSFSTYTLRFTIRFNNLKLVKQLNLQVPSNLLDEVAEKTSTRTTLTSSKRIEEQTSRRRLLAPLLNADSTTSTANLSLNFYNSVVVVSIASAILVVFGLACFSISLLLYFTSKCKRQESGDSTKKKPLNEEAANIVVYDMPSMRENLKTGGPKQTVYSLASSLSTSECGDASTTTTSANNISPSTTASIQAANNIASSSSSGPLFQTHLEGAAAILAAPLQHQTQSSCVSESSHVFDWFLQQNQQQMSRELPSLIKSSMKYQNQQMTTSNEPLSIASSSSPLSVSSTANLIRPMETESSISSSSSTTTSSSLSHHQTAAKQPHPQTDEDKNLECKYKNELYRSSHQIIYKQQLYQHGGYIKPQTPPQIINSSSCSSDETTTANKPSLGLLYEAKPLNVMMWTTNNTNTSNNSQRISAIEPDSSVNDTEATPNVNEIRQISCV